MTLTRSQEDALRRIRDHGPGAWCPGTRGRAGGAISRMFDRMTVEGLCTAPPHEITDKGRAVLRDLEQERDRRFMRRSGRG